MNKILSTILFYIHKIVSVIFYFVRSSKNEITENDVVFITGCDSGLGYEFLIIHKCSCMIFNFCFRFNFVLKCLSYGMTVFSGCYDIESDGAKFLKSKFMNSDRLHVIPFDLESDASMENAFRSVEKYVADYNKSM